MKAIVLEEPRAGAVAYRTDVEKPRPGRGEVLIRVSAVAICGTDRHIYDWDPSMQDLITPPLIPGHEFCGEVAEIGPNCPARIAVGDFVSAEMHVVCGVCKQCQTGQGHVCANTLIYGIQRPGAFAEFVKVPATNIIPLDRDRIPVRIAAFLDALGNAVHTAFKVDFAGRHVAITGFGPIGAMAAAIAHHCGAGRITITDVGAFALEQAREWAHEMARGTRNSGIPIDVLDTGNDQREESIWHILQQGGADVVWEMSGAPGAINDALRMTTAGGHIVLLGLPRNREITLDYYKSDLIFRGLTLHGIIGRKMYDTWYRMLALLGAGLSVDHVVGLEIPLSEFSRGMDTFRAGRCMKVVLYPDKE